MLVLSFTIAPITPSILLCFLVGAVLVMAGMMFFTLGAEMSMTPMGEKVGACMTRSKNILVIVLMSFVLGVIHYYFRAGSAGFSIPGAFGAQYDIDPCSSGRRRGISGSSAASYADRYCAATLAYLFLSSCFCTGILCAGEFRL